MMIKDLKDDDINMYMVLKLGVTKAQRQYRLTRVWMVVMGVRVSRPSWRSYWRRTRLSRMQTSYPRALRCSAVAQPQYPSPPGGNCSLDAGTEMHAQLQACFKNLII